MEIQVLSPSSPSPFIEFTFDSGTSTPYITAPSSPQRFGNFYFTNNPADADHLDDLARASFSINPSLWEVDDKSPTSGAGGAALPAINSDDFEFALKLERDSASADELFHSGKIKPLELEPPEPPKSPENFKFSDGTDTFSENSKFLRVSDILAAEEDDDDDREEITDECSALSPLSSSGKPASNPFGSFLSTFSLSKGYRKWSFKDFLLFRSASEGRGTSKDPLRKFAALHGGDRRKNHLRSESVEGGVGVGSVSSRRRAGGGASAHEMHYTANRAVAEEMKKKTSLAYRQGVLGCLGLNPNPAGGAHDLAKGFVGSLPRG